TICPRVLPPAASAPAPSLHLRIVLQTRAVALPANGAGAPALQATRPEWIAARDLLATDSCAGTRPWRDRTRRDCARPRAHCHPATAGISARRARAAPRKGTDRPSAVPLPAHDDPGAATAGRPPGASMPADDRPDRSGTTHRPSADQAPLAAPTPGIAPQCRGLQRRHAG